MAIPPLFDPTEEHLSLIIQALARGKVVAIPTETVYGLAADGRSEEAVAAIYALKNRPPLNPLIAHYHSLMDLELDAVLPPFAYALAERFWPGAMTLILERKEGCSLSKRASAGLTTIAARIPAHPIARKILRGCRFPLVAPSANPSGRLSSVTAQQVRDYFPAETLWILDGGRCEKGVESTIIDITTIPPQILRAGSLAEEDLKDYLPNDSFDLSRSTISGEIKAPGMSYRHYGPNYPLRLSTDNPRAGEVLLAFGSQSIPEGFSRVINLSQEGNLEEAATNLFFILHELEKSPPPSVAVMKIPPTGVGKAILDRLQRASQAAPQLPLT